MNPCGERRPKTAAFLVGLTFMLSELRLADEPPVRLYAAGSLTAVMMEMARAFTASDGPSVTSVFGASFPVIRRSRPVIQTFTSRALMRY